MLKIVTAMKVVASIFLFIVSFAPLTHAQIKACVDFYRSIQTLKSKMSNTRELEFKLSIRGSRSKDIIFDVPPGTQSYQIEIHGRIDANYLIGNLVNAKGEILIGEKIPDHIKPSEVAELTKALQDIQGMSDVSDLVGPYLSPVRNNLGVAPGYSSQLVYASKNAELPAGKTRLNIKSVLLADDHEITVRVIFKPIPPKKHVSRLKLRLVDVEGLRIEPTSQTFQFLKQQLSEIFGQAKIDIELEHGATLDKTYLEVKNDAQIARLFKADPQQEESTAIKIFFIRSFQLSEHFPADGYSPWIPGPASSVARRESGVIIASYMVPKSSDSLDMHYAFATQIGITIGHELGHYLGLSHTQELNVPFLKDTYSDTGAPGKNMMDAQPPRGGMAIVSRQQGEVLRAHPLVIQTPSR